MTDSPYQFPECLHPVAASLHMLGFDPGGMVIELPVRTVVASPLSTAATMVGI